MRRTGLPPKGTCGDDNVVVLERFRSGRSLSPLRQAEAYWLALSDNGAVPRRSQIDPRAISNVLGHSFILQRIGRRSARFRLAGDHLNDLAGMDLRGTPFTALFAYDYRAEAGAILQRVFSGPSIAELRLERTASSDGRLIEARMLLLPLTTEAGDVARALGVLVADSDRVRPPVRFGISNKLLRPVAREAGITASPDPQPAAQPDPLDDPQPASGFAEHGPAPLSPPPYLRLVK